jgi:hypothetical protein
VNHQESRNVNAAIVDRPTERSDDSLPVPATREIRVRRVFRLEVPRRDGMTDVLFVPMERGGAPISHRGAVYTRRTTMNTPAGSANGADCRR